MDAYLSSVSTSSGGSSDTKVCGDLTPLDLKDHSEKVRARLKRNLCKRAASQVAEKLSLSAGAIEAALLLFNVKTDADIESLRTFISVVTDSGYASCDALKQAVADANQSACVVKDAAEAAVESEDFVSVASAG